MYGLTKRIPKEQVVDTDITIKKLYKRDRGKCYICGCQCSFDDWKVSKRSGNKYPGDTYPEIEHMIPISRGGLHSWDNVRLACHRCNALKSDNILFAPLDKDFAYKEKKDSSKRTKQLSLDGELIKVWDSTMEIQRKLGFSAKRIQEVCRGEGKTAFGFCWKYEQVGQRPRAVE